MTNPDLLSIKEKLAAMQAVRNEDEAQTAQTKAKLVSEIVDMIEGNRKLSERADWRYHPGQASEAQFEAAAEKEISAISDGIERDRALLKDLEVEADGLAVGPLSAAESLTGIRSSIQAEEQKLRERETNLEKLRTQHASELQAERDLHHRMLEPERRMAKDDIGFSMDQVLASHLAQGEDTSRYNSNELIDATTAELARRKTQRSQIERINLVRDDLNRYEGFLNQAEVDFKAIKNEVEEGFGVLVGKLTEKDYLATIDAVKLELSSAQNPGLLSNKAKAKIKAEAAQAKLSKMKQELVSNANSLFNKINDFFDLHSPPQGAKLEPGSVANIFFSATERRLGSGGKDLTDKRAPMQNSLAVVVKQRDLFVQKLAEYRNQSRLRMNGILLSIHRLFKTPEEQ